MDDWPVRDNWRSRDADDPGAPRCISVMLEPEEARDWAGLARWLTVEKGLAPRAGLDFEPLEAWRAFDGSDVRLAIAETRRNGEPHIAWIVARRNAEGPYPFGLLGMEVAARTYRDWGGVARVLMLRGIIPTVESFPAERREEVAAASPPRQVAIFEAALDKQLETFAAQMVAATQAQTLLRMQELNYDLLFGNDITDIPD